jgi:acyl-CoA synthetase (AMP-forming)/AMP-acid ligase II
MISHHALDAALAGIQERLAIGPRDVMASWAPLHSSPGLVRYVFGPVYFDCPSHLIRPSALQLSRWLELISSVQATVTSAPDVAYRLAARIGTGRMDLRSLRVATSGGEVVRADTIRAFEQQFHLTRIVQPAYGLTEATVIANSTAPGDPLTADAGGRVSCGRPIRGLEVRIEQRDPARPDGEILLRGPSLFDGYFDDETGTQAVWRDGWLHTGDWGVMIDGQLYPVSRERLLIKRAGASLAPREIEEPLEQIDHVLSAAAVGRTRSDGLTEELVIVVETHRDTRADLRTIAGRVEQAVTDTIGSLPAQVIIVRAAAIPRTTGGKIRHAELRQLVAEGSLLNTALFAS